MRITLHCKYQNGTMQGLYLWVAEITGHINVDNSATLEQNKKRKRRAIVSSNFSSRRDRKELYSHYFLGRATGTCLGASHCCGVRGNAASHLWDVGKVQSYCLN